MDKCLGVSDVGLAKIAVRCGRLERLSLKWCMEISDLGIDLLCKKCPELKHLDVSYLKVTSESLRSIASLPKLEVLAMVACPLVDDFGLQFWKCLSFATGVEQLGSHCSLLEELDLTDCSGINDRGLECLSRCSRLVCLKLGLCANISDKGLFYIASDCSKLHELDLYRSTGIGDDGLAALSSGCKKLKKLNLSYCNNITDRGIKLLGYLEELSDVELRGLGKITSVGLTAFAAKCKTLADLDLKHCWNIDDKGFWALAYYSQNLRQINLSYCNISDMALCMMMGNLTRLQDAKLVLLKNVTVAGFELALRACCVRIKKDSCLSNMQYELEKTGSYNATSVLIAALRTTLNEARLAIDMVTEFSSLSISFREQVAIEDCKELLDFSVSELAWSLAGMEKIRASDNNVCCDGNLKAWLSAALINQDTCLEGFEGTDRHLENFMKGKLETSNKANW
ncbi:hypothetical protein GH714_026073 [Hevea brasiliensis]|uniref:Pectinesterase inhibitor domain-containing protein n=1 Tax=Hevea brasiliensis TaxID=3981 RepID=A0A6A6M0Q0_HEVBR|nr:hypothetical protein GH714_026073 [Hevea brasiliensis]